MKLFLDSAILKEIEWAEERGLIDGVTTSPTLLVKTDRRLGEVVRDILKLINDRPVGIGLVSQTKEDLLEEAKTVAKLGKTVVVTIPITDDGLSAVRLLEQKNIRTNVTLVYTAAQALLAARAGATFVSLFTSGQVGEAGVISETVEMFKKYNLQTYIIAAQPQNVRQVEEAALAEATIVSVPFKVLVQMFRHEFTDKGIKQYLSDWEKVSK